MAPTNAEGNERLVDVKGRLGADFALLKEMDAFDRARAAGELIEFHRTAMAAMGAIRRLAVTELRDQGASLGDIAEELGITRQAVHRLINNTK